MFYDIDIRSKPYSHMIGARALKFQQQTTTNEESFHCQLVTIACMCCCDAVSCVDDDDDVVDDDAAFKYFLCNYSLVNRLTVSEEAVESA